MFSNNGLTLSDIAAVTGGNGGIGNGNGFWVLIILFAMFGGWGGYAGAGNGGGNSIATYGDIQRGFDTQEIVTKLNGLENGLCSLGYDQLAQMNGINNNVTNMGFSLQQAIQQNTIANMQQANALQAQLNDCCCQNREAIAQVRFDEATNTCAITTAVNQAAQNIMLNCNNNYRQLHDEIFNLRMEDKDAKIAEQAQTINFMNLNSSQDRQTERIVTQTVAQILAQLKGNACGACC